MEFENSIIPDIQMQARHGWSNEAHEPGGLEVLSVYVCVGFFLSTSFSFHKNTHIGVLVNWKLHWMLNTEQDWVVEDSRKIIIKKLKRTLSVQMSTVDKEMVLQLFD